MDNGTITSAGNEIRVTSDYDQFQIMEANRDQSRGHIEALKAAFEEMGNLTAVQPILVNEQMQIIDGQHRFTACQELGEPIYYTQVSGLSIADARKINVLHRSWNMDDYAKSYAAGGDASYRRFLQLKEDFGFTSSLTLIYAKGGNNRGIHKDFRNGNFTLTPEEDAATRFRLELLSDVAEKTDLARTRDLAVALLQVEKIDGFDHNRLMDKLERYSSLLTRQGGVGEYLRVLEEIYNRGHAESTRLRLF